MEVIHERCAGLDVHKETVVGCALELPRFGGWFWAWVFNGFSCLRLFALVRV